MPHAASERSRFATLLASHEAPAGDEARDPPATWPARLSEALVPIDAAVPPAEALDALRRTASERAGLAVAARLVRSLLARRWAPEAEPFLEALRTDAYRQAASTWEDRWLLARVCEAEELRAELARQRGQLQQARRAWRSAWWIRRLLGEQGTREDRRAVERADEVMALLDDAAAAEERQAEARRSGSIRG